MTTRPDGLQEALLYPLFDALLQRRSRRVSRGVRSIPAGSLSYTSTAPPQPLTELEEALLIAATGITGVTMPDMPYQTPDGQPLLGTPMLESYGGTASSPDNAQTANFFLINDSGTYFLTRPKDLAADSWSGRLTEEKLLAHARAAKVQVLAERLDGPREFPRYIGRNRHVSNVPGSTVLVPVVDVSRQYINGLLYIMSQEDGHRPTPIDDWNLYQHAGVEKWVRSGFLNKNLPLPLGYLGTFRMHVEAVLQMQNLLLTIQAMGLGGWIHAAPPAAILLGDPDFAKYGPGLGFRYEPPKKSLLRKVRIPITPLPAWRNNPVGLDGLLEGHCPPYHDSMSAAVDAIIALKFKPDGIYGSPKAFDHVYKDGLAQTFLDEAPRYQHEVIECVKDICEYIWSTYGRFPAHVDAMYVPELWVQAHHLDLGYYDSLYRHGYTDSQRQHQQRWHGDES